MSESVSTGLSSTAKPDSIPISGPPPAALKRVPDMGVNELENLRPRFGLQAVSQKLPAYNIIRFINIINLKPDKILQV